MNQAPKKASTLAALSSIALLITLFSSIAPLQTPRSIAQEIDPDIAPEEIPDQILPPQPVPPLSEVQRNAVKEIIREELQTSNEISDRVQNTVNQTFGWTITLINFLTAVLIAFPIGVGVIFWMLQQSITAKLEEQIRAKIEREVKKGLQEQVGSELEKQISGFKQELVHQKAQLQLEFVAVQREKDRVISRISQVLAERDRTLEELALSEKEISPEMQAKIQELTHQLEALKASNPNLYLTAEDYLNQGDALQFEQRYSEAIESYEQALSLQPDLGIAWAKKAMALKRSHQYSAALEANERALQIDPNLQAGWLGKAYALLNLKQYEAALLSFERAIQLNPESSAWRWYGYTQTKLEKYEDALKSLDKAIELHPDHGRSYYCKAYFHLTQNQPEQAFRNLKQAIELHPQHLEDLKTDPDFESIRTDDYFKPLFESIEPDTSLPDA
ncbi:tetratricopeptide repeat protein [Egbenema bharatensis]|uniref:tetratricopeptide repeat protein n=1 Tax=Egbenema bharatensis TaxID=3463334 RepID=UPI003A871A6C